MKVCLCKGTSVSEVLLIDVSNFTFVVCRAEARRKSGNVKYGGKEKEKR